MMRTLGGNIVKNELEIEELTGHMGETVKVHGSIYKVRKMKGFSFVLLREKREVIQCIAEEEIELPVEESCVVLTAEVVEEPRSKKGYELHIREIEVLSEPHEPSPIVINQKLVDTSIENMLDYRMVTLRNEKQRAIFKIQEGICQGFRSFLQSRNFTEIHTPKLVQTGVSGRKARYLQTFE